MIFDLNLMLSKFALVSCVYALDPESLNSVGSVVHIVDMVGKALNILVLSCGAIFIAYLIFGAYKFATAQGDPKGIAGAKQSLTYAVIGLCIVIGVFAINSIVVGILGLSSTEYGRAGGLGSGGILGTLGDGINDIVSWIDKNTPDPAASLDYDAEVAACEAGCASSGLTGSLLTSCIEDCPGVVKAQCVSICIEDNNDCISSCGGAGNPTCIISRGCVVPASDAPAFCEGQCSYSP